MVCGADKGQPSGVEAPVKKGIVVVAGHFSKEVAPSTLKSIWKQAELEDQS